MDPSYPLVPIANFLACALVLLPLFSTSTRSGTWNVAVTVFARWVASMSIIQGVNSIIWSDNVRNVAPPWCDITTRFKIVDGFVIRACTFLLTCSLHEITMCGQKTYTQTKRNKMIYDLIWTVGLPILTLLLYYIVQDGRFKIIEEEGCVEEVFESGLQILLFDVPMVILPLISAIFYCPRILCMAYRQRKALGEFSLPDPSVSGDVYLRVILLGCVDAVVTLPISIIRLVLNLLSPPTSFYPGWEEVHANFSTISVETASEWKKDLWSTVQVRYDLWIDLFSAFAFFALFGLTKEARATYRGFFWKTMMPFGLKEPPPEDPVHSVMRFGSVSNRTAEVSGCPPTTFSDGELSHSETSHSQAEGAKVFNLSPAIEEGLATSDGKDIGGDDETFPRKDCARSIDGSVI